MVEFAIVLTVLLLILLGIIDFGRLLFVTQAVKSASREAARVASVRADWGTWPTPAAGTIQKAAIDAASAATALSGGPLLQPTTNLTSTTASAAGPRCNAARATANTPVSVSVTVNFRWLTPVGALPGLSAPGLTGTKPVSSTTSFRCE